jgi:hypothetical protein
MKLMGRSKNTGLPKLADILGNDLHQISIVSCDGKEKIPHYATICHAFAIPAFVLFDLNDKSETEIENARVLQSSGDFHVQHFTSSFEPCLV